MEEQQENNPEILNGYNQNLNDTNIHVFGDNMLICQVVQLLAYIRHAIKNNLQTEIKVKVGNNIANSQFAFDVNGLEIKDYITKEEIELN